MQQQEFDQLLQMFASLKNEINKVNIWDRQDILIQFKIILNSIYEIQKICNICQQWIQQSALQFAPVQQQQQQTPQYNYSQTQNFQNNNILQQNNLQQQNTSLKQQISFNFGYVVLQEINQLKNQFNFKILEEVLFQNNSQLVEQCPICLSDLYDIQVAIQTEPVVQLQCKHNFHFNCLKPIIKQNYLKCPVCNSIQGVQVGDQPQGTMTTKIIMKPCAGYNCDTIEIQYYFRDGIRNGIRYAGTQRYAYLPNNREGQEILQLLKQAFDKKLIFTVGTSITTGLSNQIIWNGIHHKTSLSGGPTNFGYPDFDYFDRIKQELKQKGIQ